MTRLIAKYLWHVIATLRLEDGTQRIEDLGLFEATTSRRARDAARSQNQKKLGIHRYGRGGRWSGNWRFSVEVEPIERNIELELQHSCGVPHTPRSDKVIEGLTLIYNLAYADVQHAEPGDFPNQREALAQGFTYLATLIKKEP